MKKAIHYLLSISCIILIDSCRKDLDLNNLSGNWQIPVAFANLKLNNLVEDSLLLEDSTGILHLNYQQQLLNYNLEDIIDPIETGILKTVKLNSINLGTTHITESVTLGFVARGAGLIGVLILAGHGNTNEIPAINGLPEYNFPIDASEYFESMTLEEGNLVLRFTNGFPIDITNLAYKVQNQIDGAVIFEDTIPLLSAGTFEERTYPLDGKTLEGMLDAVITDMSSPGSNGVEVLIDTNDALVVDLTIKDLVPTEATAIFPRQQIANDTSVHPIELDDNLFMTSMVLRSGSFELIANSTIQDTVSYIYQIPGLSLNGVPFVTTGIVPPAPPGGSIAHTDIVDFTGYTLDLTGQNHDTINAFYSIFQSWIDSSGTLTYLSLEDSIYINSFTKEVLPEKAYGLIERDTIDIAYDSVDLDVFGSYLSGLINLDQSEGALRIENNFGIAAAFKPELLKVEGALGNLSLNAPSMGNYFNIAEASENSLSTAPVSASSKILWNDQNSNFTNLLELIPNKVFYQAQAIINPNETTIPGFLYYNKGIEAYLDIKFPLNIGFDSFLLRDTVDFNLTLNEENLDFDGRLMIYSENYFPFEASLTLEFLDENNQVIQTRTASPFINAGVESAGSKVNDPSLSNFNWLLSKEDLNELVDANSLVITCNFNSDSNSNNIYADYDLKLNMVLEWEAN